MGALYKGADRHRDPVDDRHRAGDPVHVRLGVPLKTTGGVAFTTTTIYWCGLVGLAVTGLNHLDHRVYYNRHRLSPGEVDRCRVRHRPRPPTSSRVSPSRWSRPRCPRSSSSPAILVCYGMAGLFGHRDRGDDDAGAGRYGGRARTPSVRSPTTPAASPKWPDCRTGGPQVDRRARRGRQHHQGGHQGLRHRLVRAWAHWCCCAYNEDLKFFIANSAQHKYVGGVTLELLAEQSVRRGRSCLFGGLLSVPVRRDGHDRGRAAPPARSSRRSAGNSARNPGIMKGDQQARLWPRRRPAHQSRDQGNDQSPSLLPVLVADRRVIRDLLRRGRRSGGQVGRLLGGTADAARR